MPFDKIDIESITEERRKSVAKTIRTITVEELKKLGEQVFHDLDDPSREVFFRFIAEHSDATVHHAIASDASTCFIAATQTKAFGLCREPERGFCRQQVGR
jgi:hypothetical protein